ncbi:MAG: hypothetical protein HY811_12290 [Planctomycetes bacterium]|nr:hypothetical protein [Planctomycetota bacterium]
MSNIVSHGMLMIGWPLDTPTEVGEKWAANMKANALRIYQSILAKIPDKGKFQERIAGPASTGYAGYVNPGFVSRRGNEVSDILDGQVANLRDSYEKFVRNLEHAFETVDGDQAKRFKEKVEKAKENFMEGMARRTLIFGGTRVKGRGAAAIAPHWLVNDQRVMDWLRADDKVLEGGPFRVCKIQDRSAFKAALTERVIQAGVRIIKSGFSPMVIAKENNQTNNLVQKFIDPSLGLESFSTGGLSRLDFILQGNNRLFLEVQVSQV